MVNIELLYAPLEQAMVHVHLSLPDGSCVRDVLKASGFYELYPEARTYLIGIYSRSASLETCVYDGDRVEVYRPLTCDPKEKRRRLAKS